MARNSEHGSPVWDDVIEDLQHLADTLQSGGMTAVEKKFRVTRLQMPNLPKPVKAVSSKRVKGVRAMVGVSQPVFAALLGVSPQTVKAWEQNAKQPTGSARRILTEIEHDPVYWKKRLQILCGG